MPNLVPIHAFAHVARTYVGRPQFRDTRLPGRIGRLRSTGHGRLPKRVWIGRFNQKRFFFWANPLFMLPCFELNTDEKVKTRSIIDSRKINSDKLVTLSSQSFPKFFLRFLGTNFFENFEKTYSITHQVYKFFYRK